MIDWEKYNTTPVGVGAADVPGALTGRPDPGSVDGRAAALGEFPVGAPLRFADLRFARRDSDVTVASACRARGSPESPAAARAPVAEVEAFGADTGYPQTRFDAGTLAAELLPSR